MMPICASAPSVCCCLHADAAHVGIHHEQMSAGHPRLRQPIPRRSREQIVAVAHLHGVAKAEAPGRARQHRRVVDRMPLLNRTRFVGGAGRADVDAHHRPAVGAAANRFADVGAEIPAEVLIDRSVRQNVVLSAYIPVIIQRRGIFIAFAQAKPGRVSGDAQKIGAHPAVACGRLHLRPFETRCQPAAARPQF